MLFSVEKRLRDRTLLCEKHLNERNSMTLGRHWNLFSAGALPRTPLGELMDPTDKAHVAPPDSLVDWGGGNPLPIPYSFDDFGVSAQSEPLAPRTSTPLAPHPGPPNRAFLICQWAVPLFLTFRRLWCVNNFFNCLLQIQKRQVNVNNTSTDFIWS